MTVYLLNAPILTAYGKWEFEGPLALTEARRRLQRVSLESAIGHASTAALMSRLLETDIPCRRVTVQMRPGDGALVFRLLQRIPEGKVLSDDELAELPFEFGWLRFVEESSTEPDSQE